MDGHLESEMRGAILCDPNFIRNFLTGDPDRLNDVLKQLQDDPAYGPFPKGIASEEQLYRTTLEILQCIKIATSHGQSGYRPTTLVLHSSTERTPSDDPNLSKIKPRLVLFEGTISHWETVGVPIEAKMLTTHLKVGMKQLSRCAWAAFSHQLHRRHLYGLIVCEAEATFVRFDRAGILYSRPVDMHKQLREFTQAFASLMMLDQEAFGYDPAFSTRLNQDGRLEYYVDLPESAFDGLPEEKTTTASGPSRQPGKALGLLTRRLKVVKKLCHRKGICGRATIALCLREVVRPGASLERVREGIETRSQAKKRKLDPQSQEVEQLGTRDYVLKLIWRDPKRRSEGDALEQVVGMYGLVQHLWHRDATKVCHCKQTLKGYCEECVDKTADRDNVLAGINLMDLDIEVPEDGAGETEIEYRKFSCWLTRKCLCLRSFYIGSVDTTEYSESFVRRTKRIYSRILMSSIGEPLWAADSPERFLKAILDAILGRCICANLAFLC
jgi:hypothetical protein